MKNEQIVGLLYDLLFVYDRLYWNSDVGRQEAQERIDQIHFGKYGNHLEGCYVQFKKAIQEVEEKLK